MLLLLGSTIVAKAQYGGFAGKRFILKTTIFDGKYVPVRNVEGEFALFRNLSLSLGYQGYVSNNVGQSTILGNQRLAYVKTSTVYYAIKFYFNRILPAPRGFYAYWQNGFGRGTFSGTNSLYDYNNVDAIAAGGINFVETKVPVMTYGFGMGRQSIIAKRIALDFTFGFSGTAINLSGTAASRANTDLIAPYWGSNLVSFTSVGRSSLYNPYSSSSSSTKSGSGSFGLDFRIKLGFLLF